MIHLASDNTYREYRHSFTTNELNDLMEFILERKPVTMTEVAQGFTHEDFVVVRHDVDHNLNHAVDFARVEHEYGIKSTYFILADAWYMDDYKDATILLDHLTNMGHEVGLHHYAFTQAKGNVEDAKQRFLDDSQKLGHLADMPIAGCAAHGGGDPNSMILWEHTTPQELGMLYEAYHLHGGSNYISDNRGKWRSPLQHVEGQQTHLLVHPCHWELP